MSLDYRLPDNNKSWYVVHCKTMKELYVSLKLNKLGITTFVPMLKEHLHRKSWYTPFFPGYIFIYVNIDNILISSINSYTEVLKILNFGNGPLTIDACIIEAIAKYLDVLNNTGEISYDFRPNELLRIKNGPLQDLEALFIGPNASGKRVRVFLDFLGGLREMQLDVDSLERIPQGSSLKPVSDKKRERYTRGKGRKIRDQCL